MVGVTLEEIHDETGSNPHIGSVEIALRQLKERGILQENNGYWSLADDDLNVAEVSGMMLSELAMSRGDWAEDDDDDL